MSSVKRYYLVDPWGEIEKYKNRLLFVILPKCKGVQGVLSRGGSMSRRVSVPRLSVWWSLSGRPPVQRPLDRDPARRNMEIETKIPWKEHGTSQADRKEHHMETSCEQNNLQTGEKHYLPSTSFAGGKNLMVCFAVLIKFIMTV